ncbi:MAG TPA: peroxiredoxin-like family protein [Acidobacteriaceae bacterium]|jgi:peroxiredoxin
MTSQVMTLQDKLDGITAQTRNLVQPERLELSERAVVELFATGIEDELLKPGDAAPQFALPDANGRLVRSADLLALGPLVVCFFRGRWCPYCVTELETWRDLFPAVREDGALLVAISPQTVRQNDFTATQHALPFPLLRDERATIAAEFGAAYSVPDFMQGYYRSILVNIPFINGEQSWRLPIPATFVIGRDGIIQWSQGHADFRVRPEPTEALKALAL